MQTDSQVLAQIRELEERYAEQKNLSLAENKVADEVADLDFDGSAVEMVGALLNAEDDHAEVALTITRPDREEVILSLIHICGFSSPKEAGNNINFCHSDTLLSNSYNVLPATNFSTIFYKVKSSYGSFRPSASRHFSNKAKRPKAAIFTTTTLAPAGIEYT